MKIKITPWSSGTGTPWQNGWLIETLNDKLITDDLTSHFVFEKFPKLDRKRYLEEVSKALIKHI